jgi:hypothetical protein
MQISRLYKSTPTAGDMGEYTRAQDGWRAYRTCAASVAHLLEEEVEATSVSEIFGLIWQDGNTAQNVASLITGCVVLIPS